MKKALLFLVLVAAIVLTGCGPKLELVGTKWQLATLAGQPVLTDTTVTLFFEADKCSGSDGCNFYGGSYTLKGNRLTVGKDIVSTLMACADPTMAQAAAFNQALLTATSVRVTDQQLTLLDAQGQPLATFTRMAAS